MTIPGYLAVTPTFTALCDNGAWVFSAGGLQPPAGGIGMNVCDVTWHYPVSNRTDFGCTPDWVSKGFLTVTPRHGKMPLTVTVRHFRGYNGMLCYYTIDWGDGAQDVDPQHLCFDIPENRILTNTHTYATAGSYVIRYTSSIGSNSANIRVDAAATASANQSQFASALTALQGALQALLQLLK